MKKEENKEGKDKGIDWSLILGSAALGLGALGLGYLMNEAKHRRISLGQLITGGIESILGAAGKVLFDKVFVDPQNVQRFQESTYLNRVLRSHNDVDPNRVKLMEEKQRDITEALLEDFGSSIIAVERHGSIKKGTYVGLTSDLDLMAVFGRSSFNDPGEAFKVVLNSLKTYQAQDFELKQIYPQRRSVKLVFRIDPYDIDIDLVPALERRDFKTTGEVLLYNDQVLTLNPTFVSSDPDKQSKTLDNYPGARKVIRLLKVWKSRSGLRLKSIFLEQMVVRVFRDLGNDMPESLYGKLMVVLHQLGEQIETASLPDPGNPAKDLAKLHSPTDKALIRDHVRATLDDLNRDIRMLTDYFPLKRNM